MNPDSDEEKIRRQIIDKTCRWPHCTKPPDVTRVSALDASDGLKVPLCREHEAQGDALGYWAGDELRHPGPPMTWIEPKGYPGHLWILGRECTIWLQPRPYYCDRGRYHATLDVWGELALSVDDADGWPRYYFDLGRAKLEIEAWLKVRKQG